jgi:hypothetical protein
VIRITSCRDCPHQFIKAPNNIIAFDWIRKIAYEATFGMGRSELYDTRRSGI